jgi:hypothetical protein
MCVGRIVRSVAVGAWLGSAALWPALADTPPLPGEAWTSPDASSLVPPEGSDFDRVGGGGFVAMPWQPRALGDPDMVIDRVMSEALDRAHRRVSVTDLEADAGEQAVTLSDMDSGWEGMGELMAEHRLRRLRQIANLLPDSAGAKDYSYTPSADSGEALPINASTARLAAEDVLMLRILKEMMTSIQNGTFFTKERIAVALLLVFGIAVLSRAAALRGR